MNGLAEEAGAARMGLVEGTGAARTAERAVFDALDDLAEGAGAVRSSIVSSGTCPSGPEETSAGLGSATNSRRPRSGSAGSGTSRHASQRGPSVPGRRHQSRPPARAWSRRRARCSSVIGSPATRTSRSSSSPPRPPPRRVQARRAASARIAARMPAKGARNSATGATRTGRGAERRSGPACAEARCAGARAHCFARARRPKSGPPCRGAAKTWPRVQPGS